MFKKDCKINEYFKIVFCCLNKIPVSGCTSPVFAAFVALLLVIVTPLYSAATVQDKFPPNKSREFSSLLLGIQGTVNINRNEFHDFWESAPGINVFVSTPFYWGTISMGLQGNPFHSLKEAVPDFFALLAYLRWGPEFSLHRSIVCSGSILAGSYATLLSEHPGDESEKRVWESELCFGVVSSVSIGFKKDWTLQFSANYLHIYFQRRIRLLYFAAGVSCRFSTPAWLKEILR